MDIGHEFLKQLVEHLGDAVCLIDPESSALLYCNQAGLADLDSDRGGMSGRSLIELQKDIAGEAHWRSLADEIRRTGRLTFVGRHLRADGTELPVEINFSTLQYQQKDYFLAVMRNISRRMAQQAALMKRSEQLWFALNEASDGLWDWNIKTDEVFFSIQLKRMLGYGPDELKPVFSTWTENIHPEDAGRVQMVMDEHLAGLRDRYKVEYRLRNRNGHYLWVHDQGKICHWDGQGQPARAVGMVQDITERKLLEERLQQQASFDALTGLRNRRECESLLAQHVMLAARLGNPLGVCLFDVDHFKSVNDRHGHLVGDTVLSTVARRVQEAVRGSDLLFRWGGEEFLLLCPNTAEKELCFLAEKVRQALEQTPWDKIVPSLHVTASFGVAAYPHDGESPERLVMIADTALYRAKSGGRNQVACSREA